MWNKAEADDIRKQVDAIEYPVTEINPMVEEVLAFWKEYRPKMHADLSQAKILTEYAILVVERFYEEKCRLMVVENLDEGDAGLIAGEHLLMIEEESEEEDDEMEE